MCLLAVSLVSVVGDATKLRTVAGDDGKEMDPTQTTELGSMLFTRCVSGTRQVLVLDYYPG